MTENLGQNLKAHREAAGYSQVEFSSLCGISRQSLHKHEAGKVKPTPENLMSYAKVLGISASELKENLHPKTWNFKVIDSLEWASSSKKL